jgi:general stress protein 26
MHSRPMATQEVDPDGNLWFFTAKDTPKTTELRANPAAQVSYTDPGKNLYVAVSGRAEVVRDPKKAKELWNPFYRAWFPKGLDDPELCLLKVAVERAEYWDSPSGAVVHLIGLAKAVVSGKSYQGEGGDHGKLGATG